MVGLADTLVGRDLAVRQTSSSTKCDATKGYTSQNGLNFTLYCEQNNPFNGTTNISAVLAT